MSRLKETCCGDCSTCELLLSGSVDMIPCLLDQIFQRVQKIEKAMKKDIVFSGVELNNMDYELQGNVGKSQSKRANNGKNDVG